MHVVDCQAALENNSSQCLPDAVMSTCRVRGSSAVRETHLSATQCSADRDATQCFKWLCDSA